MIHGLSGLLGSGKGLQLIKKVYDQLVDGGRDVVTNLPVRTMPWVNGQGEPMIGLRSYIVQQMDGVLFDFEIDEILKRLLVIEDIKQGWDLFMWRRDGNTGEWFKMHGIDPDEKGRPSRFDPEQVKLRRCAPCFIATDEAWQFYPNNGGYSREPLLPFYARQQRKLRDEWWICSQSFDDVDSLLWRLTQDFTECRNHGFERISIFRQPSFFSTKTYRTNPCKPGAVLMHEWAGLLDAKGLAQCYDTTAGVGMSGGQKGDFNQKFKGLHIGWLAFGVVLLVAALMLLVPLMGKGSHLFFRGFVGGVKNSSNTPAIHSSSPLPSSRQESLSRDISKDSVSSVVSSNALFCLGWCKIGKDYMAFLSDGTDFSSADHELDWIQKSKISILGKVYDIRGKAAHSEYVSPPPSEMQFPVAPDRPVNDAQVTVIGHRSQNALPVIDSPAGQGGQASSLGFAR